jgi:hypothetical protein
MSASAGNEELFLEMGRLGPDASAEDLTALDERFNTYGLPGEQSRVSSGYSAPMFRGFGKWGSTVPRSWVLAPVWLSRNPHLGPR